MKTAFKQIPEPLQRQILYKLGYGIAILLVSIVFLFSSPDLLSVLSCAAITVFFIVSAFLLFRRAVVGDYVVIRGEVSCVALTTVRRRTKMITLHTENDGELKVQIRQRLKKIRAGAHVTLYVAANMPVYKSDNAHLLHSYLAIETKGGE